MMKEEIPNRISKAIFEKNKLSSKKKTRIYESILMPILIYGSKTNNLKQKNNNVRNENMKENCGSEQNT